MVDRFNFKLKFHILYARWLYIINSFPFLKTCYLSILLVALVARFTFNLEKFTSQHFDEHRGSTPLSRMRNSSPFPFFFPSSLFSPYFFFITIHRRPRHVFNRSFQSFASFVINYPKDRVLIRRSFLFVSHLPLFAILSFSSPSISA